MFTQIWNSKCHSVSNPLNTNLREIVGALQFWIWSDEHTIVQFCSGLSSKYISTGYHITKKTEKATIAEERAPFLQFNTSWKVVICNGFYHFHLWMVSSKQISSRGLLHVEFSISSIFGLIYESFTNFIEIYLFIYLLRKSVFQKSHVRPLWTVHGHVKDQDSSNLHNAYCLYCKAFITASALESFFFSLWQDTLSQWKKSLPQFWSWRR